ncbi:MAG TPA: hypothetical protein DDW26_02755 [Rhizobiales bacterium]|nr:hypothetical protein [Hyphomicrobiales bacterium]
MPPPNKILMPGTNDQDLGDIRRRLSGLETAGAAPVPRLYNESVDASHAMDLDFPLPNGVQAATAKLSFKFKPYRTTSSFAGGNTGGESVGHTHASAAHSHSHAHTIPIDAVGVPGPNVTIGGGGGTNLFYNVAAANTAPINADATSTTPGSTGGASVDHTHSVGASSLGVGEGTSTTISAIGVDGVDKTALLGGGPWIADTVDLDVSKVLPLGDGHWHRITLTTAGQGRIVAELNI